MHYAHNCQRHGTAVFPCHHPVDLQPLHPLPTRLAADGDTARLFLSSWAAVDALLAIRTAHEGDEGCDAFRDASLLLNRLFCAGNRTAGRLLHHLLESGEEVRAVRFDVCLLWNVNTFLRRQPHRRPAAASSTERWRRLSVCRHCDDVTRCRLRRGRRWSGWPARCGPTRRPRGSSAAAS